MHVDLSAIGAACVWVQSGYKTEQVISLMVLESSLPFGFTGCGLVLRLLHLLLPDPVAREEDILPNEL